jgi:hypothetical protein
VDSPPIGEGGIPAEFILNPKNTIEWKPRETMIPLVILLRQTTRITGLSITCSSPVVVRVEAVEMQFEPPGMQQNIIRSVDLRQRVLDCLVIAEKIEISNVTIVGEMIPTSFQEPNQMINRRLSFNDFVLRRIGTNLELVDDIWRQVKVPNDCTVYGFDFRSLMGFRELVVKYLPKSGQSEWEVEHFRLSKYPDHCYVLLPNPVEMRECRILFVGGTGDVNRELSVKLLAAGIRPLVILQPRSHF